jgi:hypothetical protein
VADEFGKRRCYLVYALACEGTSARDANAAFNEYVADARRGIAVFHDHFVGRHGGVAVFDVRSEGEFSALAEPGPLGGWQLEVHPLTFALTATGFVAQTEFTLDRYRGTTLAELAATEERDPRYWWQEGAAT